MACPPNFSEVQPSSVAAYDVLGDDGPRLASSCGATSIQPTVNAVFQGNKKVVVYGGTFTIQNTIVMPDRGFSRLTDVASKDAMHDSSSRYPPPKCHPDTRKNIVQTLIQWIKNPKPGKPVYWLHAPFGHGKSAVIQTVLDILFKEGRHNLVAGAFFFGRGKPGRDKAEHLIRTIAYQMAVNLSGLRELIDAAVVSDPRVLESSSDVQVERLIVRPLIEHINSLGSDSASYHAPTVFIDGLDECDTIDGQLEVLNLVFEALDEYKIPLRFIIASRPETHIDDELSQPPFIHLVERLSLPDNEREMIVYLTQKFSDIRATHPSFRRSAPTGTDTKEWPSQTQIRQLVQRACGQYIFLDTTIRFINSRRHNPITRFETIIGRLQDSAVFSNMDELYTLILEECPSEYEDILKTILLLVCCIFGDQRDSFYRNLNVAGISHICGYPPEDIELVVDMLAAVLRRRGGGINNSDLIVLHTSFREFLQDDARSGRFSCSEDDFKKWNCQVQDAFKNALSAKSFIYHQAGVAYIRDMIMFASTEPEGWTTSSELLYLLRQGRAWAFSNSNWDTPEFRAWYGLVHNLTYIFSIFRWLAFDTQRIKWLAGEIDTPFTPQLHSLGLEIWKVVADRHFAALDASLASALLGSLIYGLKPKELAAQAELEEEEMMLRLEPTRGILWTFSENSSGGINRIHLCDLEIMIFRKDGQSVPLNGHRDEFYAAIPQRCLVASL